MANKGLRTPIIKMRSQGGTFFTFGSAMEDIGLNINDRSNKIELSHYAILDIPAFSSDGTDGTSLNLRTSGNYDSNIGDMIFTESFQNYVLNMETIIRNQKDYNFAASSTVSEKIFWKWLFKDKNLEQDFTQTKSSNGTIYYKENNPIVKGFGRISAGSQRTDDYGIYNETFVQIPSSYGQMECLFKTTEDENYNTSKYFHANDTIENIKDSEMNNNYLNATGVYAKSITDDNKTYTIKDIKDTFGLELDINNLSLYYNDNELTYDALGFGEHISDDFTDTYTFNAILVYYSIYDKNGNSILATNLYGIYILDKSQKYIDINNSTRYEFPKITKRRTTSSETGTSFAFRINAKPTSAYSGDVEIVDNSTTSYTMSEDFNDVLKNLSSAIRTLNNNAMMVYEISENSKVIKGLYSDLIVKIDDINKTVQSIQTEHTRNEKITLKSDTVKSDAIKLNKSDAIQIINAANVTYDKNGNIGVTFNDLDINNLSEPAQYIIRYCLRKEVDNNQYYDIMRYILVLTAALK